MHEMSIAMSIVELAQKESMAAGGGRILRVEVEIGDLAGVMAEALEFCFEAACRDTLAQGAELIINRVPGEGECSGCRQRGPMNEQFALCPSCGGIMRAVQGRELRLVALVTE